MTRRFTANYLHIPGVGLFKLRVVEIGDEGAGVRVFELTEELENVSWVSGLLVLCRKNDAADKLPPDYCRCNPDIPAGFFRELEFELYRVYPFDFPNMKPFEDSRFYKLAP